MKPVTGLRNWGYYFAPLRWAFRIAAGRCQIRCQKFAPLPVSCQQAAKKNRPKKTPAENFNRGFSLSVTNIRAIAPSYPLCAVKSEVNDRPQIDNTILY